MQRSHGCARVAGRQLSGPAGVKTGKSADRLSVLSQLHCRASAYFSWSLASARDLHSPAPERSSLEEHSHLQWVSLPTPPHGWHFHGRLSWRRGGGHSMGRARRSLLSSAVSSPSGRVVFLVSAAGSVSYEYIIVCMALIHNNSPNTWRTMGPA